MANLTYDSSQAQPRNIVVCAQNGLNVLSTYGGRPDPRGTSDLWNSSSNIEHKIAMRIPYGGATGIANKSKISYIEVGYHTSYVNPAANVTFVFDGHTLNFTQSIVNTVNSHWIVRYVMTGLNS